MTSLKGNLECSYHKGLHRDEIMATYPDLIALLDGIHVLKCPTVPQTHRLLGADGNVAWSQKQRMPWKKSCKW